MARPERKPDLVVSIDEGESEAAIVERLLTRDQAATVSVDERLVLATRAKKFLLSDQIKKPTYARSVDVQSQLRKTFLESLLKYAPCSFDGLSRDVLPELRIAFGMSKSGEAESGKRRLMTWQDTPKWRYIKGQPGLGDLEAALVRWALHYNLTTTIGGQPCPVEWILDDALFTVRMWLAFPEMLKERRLTLHSRAMNLPECQPRAHFKFEPPVTAYGYQAGWIPEIETWKAFEKRMRTSFAAALASHHKSVESSLPKKRLDPVTQSRWLVYRQACGMSVAEIADKDCAKSAATVSEATGRLARDLGITLQSQPAGRPRNASVRKRRKQTV